MHMPTRNVYVSDEDQNLFQEAAELAGGFSPAVSEALREYVKRRKLMRAVRVLEEMIMMNSDQKPGMRRIIRSISQMPMNGATTPPNP